MTTSTRAWLAGTLAAFISGGSSAVTAGFASTLITPESYNMHSGIWHVIELMIATFIISGLLGAFHRLQSSPLPVAWTQETEVRTVATTMTHTAVATELDDARMRESDGVKKP